MHALAHSRVACGVAFRTRDGFEEVGAAAGLRFFLVSPRSAPIQRQRAERLSRSAAKKPVDLGGYDLPPYFADNPYQTPAILAPHVLLAAHDRHLVAMTVFEWRALGQLYRWSATDGGYKQAEDHLAMDRWAVIHIWVIPSFRGRGLGRELVTRMADISATEPPSLGWMTPFTSGGFAILRSLSPDQFFRVDGLPRIGSPALR